MKGWFALLLVTSCSGPTATTDGGTDSSTVDGSWRNDPAVHAEISIRQTTAKTTVSATITDGAKCTDEDIPATTGSEPSCTWRSCDPSTPGTPIAIGDIVVQCSSGSVTLKANGNTYAPVDFTGAMCPSGGKINIAVGGEPPTQAIGDVPGFATITTPDLTTSTTFPISGGFSLYWSDTTTSDIVTADFVGKGADGSNGELACGLTSVAGSFSISSATMARLAPGSVAYTGGTSSVAGGGTNFVVTVLNVGNAGNITLQ